jgi:endo-1,4-beta-xylanase
MGRLSGRPIVCVATEIALSGIGISQRDVVVRDEQRNVAELISRRSMVARILGTSVACAFGTTRALAAPDTLEAAAAHGDRFFGSAVRINRLSAEEDYRAAVLRECYELVPEFELNWNEVEPAYGQLSFERVDNLSTLAIKVGKRLRGHTLLWHLSVPQWAVDMLRERPDWDLIARYFGSVIPRYGDVIEQWEVVNEPIETGYRSDGLRESIFLTAFGPDYINRALTQARVFAPHAQLLINEYGLEYDNPEQRDRRYLLLKLLERVKRSGVPLDGLGLQSHLDLRKGHISAPEISAFLREVVGMGLSLTVTELDVKESDYIASAQERDRIVGDEVRRYLDVVLSQPNVNGVITWGLSDRHSWLEVTMEDYARFPGAWTDGSSPGFNRGLPFDSSMRPKPMYYSIRDALWSAPPDVRRSGR